MQEVEKTHEGIDFHNSIEDWLFTIVCKLMKNARKISGMEYIIEYIILNSEAWKHSSLQ